MGRGSFDGPVLRLPFNDEHAAFILKQAHDRFGALDGLGVVPKQDLFSSSTKNGCGGYKALPAGTNCDYPNCAPEAVDS